MLSQQSLGEEEQTIEFDIANIIKAVAYWDIYIENLKIKISENPNFDVDFLWKQMSLDQKDVTLDDLENFLINTRIPASNRELHHLIQLNSNNPELMNKDAFYKTVLPYTSEALQKQVKQRVEYNQRKPKQVHMNQQIVQNNTLKLASEIFEQELLFYREIQGMKKDFLSRYPVNASLIYQTINFKNKEKIDYDCIAEFMEKLGVTITEDEYKGFLHRTSVDEDDILDYQELVYWIFPKEPLDYPDYRQEKITLEKQKQMLYKKMHQFKVDVSPMIADRNYLDKKKELYKTVYDDYKPETNFKKKYLCDMDYLSKLKKYEISTFQPHKDYDFKYHESTKTIQNHDDFFRDFYEHLSSKQRGEDLFNLYGKRFTYEPYAYKAQRLTTQKKLN